jgi:hypothetical protein
MSQKTKDSKACEPAEKVRQARAVLLDVTDRLEEAIYDMMTGTGSGDDANVKEQRGRLRRLVGVLSTQSGMCFHQAWVMLYHEHFKRTGVHVIAASGGADAAHLDYAEREGELPRLLETVMVMLTDDRYAPETK